MRVERKTLVVNTRDFSSFFTDVGYDVKYVKRLGALGGMMQDGSMTEDLLVRKAVVTLPCYPLNEDQLSELLTELYSLDYPIVTYFDPWRKTDRTVYAIVDDTKQKYKGRGADGLFYWSGKIVTLTEK